MCILTYKSEFQTQSTVDLDPRMSRDNYHLDRQITKNQVLYQLARLKI